MNGVTFEVQLLPDLLKFGFNQDEVQRNINEWLVLSLFTDGAVSTGKAARLLNIPRIGFLALLRKRGIAYIDYSPQELADEFASVKTLDVDKAK